MLCPNKANFIVEATHNMCKCLYAASKTNQKIIGDYKYRCSLFGKCKWCVDITQVYDEIKEENNKFYCVYVDGGQNAICFDCKEIILYLDIISPIP